MILKRWRWAVLLPLLLAGCGGEPPPPVETFTPLDYDYLNKIRLNVGTIEVENNSTPQTGADGATDVAAQSPAPPEPALELMAHERLAPTGLTGTAVFVIDQASILRGDGGALNGVLAVHLDILTAGGTRVGYAEARVTRQHVPGSDGEDPQSALYDLTKQMMADMNVELEYQIRRTLRDWIVRAGAATPAPVTSESLAPPAPPTPPPSATPPDATLPPDQPPQQMSPPPGYLTQPPATY